MAGGTTATATMGIGTIDRTTAIATAMCSARTMAEPTASRTTEEAATDMVVRASRSASAVAAAGNKKARRNQAVWKVRGSGFRGLFYLAQASLARRLAAPRRLMVRIML